MRNFCIFITSLFFSSVAFSQESQLEPTYLQFSTVPASTLNAIYSLSGINLENGAGIGTLDSKVLDLGVTFNRYGFREDGLFIKINEGTILEPRTTLDSDRLTFRVDGINQAQEQWQIGRSGTNPANTLNPLQINRINIAEGGGASFNTALHIDPNNLNVGIMNNAPNDALDVTGDIDASGCIQTGDAFNIGGACISDKRFKTRITSLEGQLDLVMSLRPVRFEWKDPAINGGKAEDMGLIAQEVESILPEMVVTGKDGYKRIQYDIRLQMRMIKALQEQQLMMESQKKGIQDQENRIANLEKTINDQEELIKTFTSEREALTSLIAQQKAEFHQMKEQVNKVLATTLRDENLQQQKSAAGRK
ncbi:MAG: tail fiber domain-containing protein [Saprospiraceae bacterium]|nr:tail fiber domain-containing protein [Saprospiraceae bacterium]